MTAQPPDPPPDAPTDPPPGPLAGVRVLDLTAVVMGPLATQILGDLGADVITVENRQGDLNRTMSRGPVRGLSGVSLNLLRNKRNLTLDIAHPDGRQALLRIAATCDVFVTNLRPASLQRLELTYEDVRAVRPDIIYCQAGGFPADSPLANEPAFDDIIQASGGVPDLFSRAGLEPVLMPTLLADKVSGLVIAYSIIAALFHRERTGEGQRVEIAMTDALKAFLLAEHGGSAIAGRGPAGYPRILTSRRAPARTADGGWIAVQPHRDEQWKALARAAGLDDLAEDPKLTNRGIWHEPSFGYETLGRVLATRTTAQWLAFCSEHGIPAAEVVGLDELIESLPDAEHDVTGTTYKVIPSPARFSATPASIRRSAPLAGQHNREVLAEVGLTDAEIDALTDSGVLGPNAPE
jgi:crotonobetainyl-CoA:carnitine CoA-transferase CaiB-like acyl-CoA transferase